MPKFIQYFTRKNTPFSHHQHQLFEFSCNEMLTPWYHIYYRIISFCSKLFIRQSPFRKENLFLLIIVSSSVSNVLHHIGISCEKTCLYPKTDAKCFPRIIVLNNFVQVVCSSNIFDSAYAFFSQSLYNYC